MDNIKILEELTEGLLSGIGIDTKIKIQETDDNVYQIDLENVSEAGLLIGYKGENLNAIQTVLSLMYRGKTGDWAVLNVNIGDYKEKQESKLKELADQAVLRLDETGQPQPIYNLTAFQRRVIHLYLSENKEIKTESEGEGDNRYLVISSK